MTGLHGGPREAEKTTISRQWKLAGPRFKVRQRADARSALKRRC